LRSWLWRRLQNRFRLWRLRRLWMRRMRPGLVGRLRRRVCCRCGVCRRRRLLHILGRLPLLLALTRRYCAGRDQSGRRKAGFDDFVRSRFRCCFGRGALFLATTSEAQMPVGPLKSKIAVTQVALLLLSPCRGPVGDGRAPLPSAMARRIAANIAKPPELLRRPQC
jgi:hypothetical protein